MNSMANSHIWVVLTIVYEVLPKDLSISPQVWFTYTENLLEGTPNKQSYIAIVDDLKSDHIDSF